MEFKGTKKDWHIVEYAGFLVIQDGQFYEDKNILDFEIVGEVQAKANAKLMVNSLILMEKLNEARIQLAQLRRSMTAHPDCTEGSEFDDFTSSSQELENEIEQLIKEVTE